MRIKWMIIFFLGLSFESFGQNLRVGFGFVNERSFSKSVVQLDSVLVFEATRERTSDLMSFVRFDWPLTERLYANSGTQFYLSPVFLTAKYPKASKGWSTSVYNLEMPLGLSYLLVKKNQLKISLELSAVPVFAIQKFTPFPVYEGLFGLDWTQEIVDVLDAIETIPEPFYVNYQYGLSAEYKRFGLTIFKSDNVDRSISNSYTLYDQNYNFQRRISSTRLGMYYSFGLKKGMG